MAVISAEVAREITNFLALEIDSKVLDGITYTLILKEGKDLKLAEQYLELKEKINRLGFRQDEIFRVFSVSNGYIFDLDLNVAKQLTMEMSKMVSVATGGQLPAYDRIGNGPDERRAKDIELLARHTHNQLKEGNRIFDIALFSRNIVPRIVVSGKDSGNKGNVTLKYPAFAIRHWDVETVNKMYLRQNGCAIHKIESHEILPSKTGVRFTVHAKIG